MDRRPDRRPAGTWTAVGIAAGGDTIAGRAADVDGQEVPSVYFPLPPTELGERAGAVLVGDGRSADGVATGRGSRTSVGHHAAAVPEDKAVW